MVTVVSGQDSPTTRTYLRYVQVKNTGACPLPAPTRLAFSGLPAGVVVTNRADVTTGSSPYVSVNTGLAPGQCTLVAERFACPTALPAGALPGTAHVLVGAGTPW
jgi:hypothetical protein